MKPTSLLKLKSLYRPVILGLTLSTFSACGPQTTHKSDILVTSVDHTEAKRQSIGNCWLYAHATWLESLLLSHSGERVNVSESYWTYWHWYNQIVGGYSSEIVTGGTWSVSSSIIREHGWMTEKDFIPDEADAEMSARQNKALQDINALLKPGGRLETPESRTEEAVMAELDRAFGVKMKDLTSNVKNAKETIIGKVDSQNISLYDALSAASPFSWQVIDFQRVFGKDTTISPIYETERKKTLKRVMKALNDHKPVVMSLMIDFNALDTSNQTFTLAKLKQSGRTGRQGGHMVVLQDYAVKDVPGIGVIAEGDQPDEVKAKAIEGSLTMLKAKNSWGKNRPDRGLTDGYTRFDIEYLTSQLEWKSDETGSSSEFYTTLSDFVLPPGY